jgi:hypothetical protein
VNVCLFGFLVLFFVFLVGRGTENERLWCPLCSGCMSNGLLLMAKVVCDLKISKIFVSRVEEPMAGQLGVMKFLKH